MICIVFKEPFLGLYNIPVKLEWLRLIFPFGRCGNWGAVSWTDWLKVLKLTEQHCPIKPMQTIFIIWNFLVAALKNKTVKLIFNTLYLIQNSQNLISACGTSHISSAQYSLVWLVTILLGQYGIFIKHTLGQYIHGRHRPNIWENSLSGGWENGLKNIFSLGYLLIERPLGIYWTTL